MFPQPKPPGHRMANPALLGLVPPAGGVALDAGRRRLGPERPPPVGAGRLPKGLAVPPGPLDATRLRSFTPASFRKLALDAGQLPELARAAADPYGGHARLPLST